MLKFRMIAVRILVIFLALLFLPFSLFADLDDPILKTTFYSPILATAFDASDHAVSALSWGQQAHVPNVNRAGLLYYERLKDLGSGIIGITYVIYNFGDDVIDYLNTPWGGIRKSVLPVTLLSNPDGSFRIVSAGWEDLKWEA